MSKPDDSLQPLRLLIGCLDRYEQLETDIYQFQQRFPQAELTLLFWNQPIPEQAIPWPTWSYQTDWRQPQRERDWVQQLRDRAFNRAILFSPPRQSCLPLAYLCYLGGIPIRIGDSSEFAGALLTHPLSVWSSDR